MINVLIPIAGGSAFFPDTAFPKPLIEVGGLPMIEYVFRCMKTIDAPKRFIFVVNQDNCVQFHLDNTLRLLAGADPIVIIEQQADAKGAVCSCLLAIEYIDNDEPLIISNGDQFIDENIHKVLADFETKKAEGGLITFESVHPKWSYVKLDSDGRVIETAEKNPISKHAIAGFYYFRQGKRFVQAAKASILARATVNDLYFIAPCYNELILQGMDVATHAIDSSQYHSFYSIDKIKQFENTELLKRMGVTGGGA